jgi:hypothetical protein
VGPDCAPFFDFFGQYLNKGNGKMFGFFCGNHPGKKSYGQKHLFHDPGRVGDSGLEHNPGHYLRGGNYGQEKEGKKAEGLLNNPQDMSGGFFFGDGCGGAHEVCLPI